MAINSRHIIRRQTFELTCASGQAAAAWQQRLGELCGGDLLSELEVQFDRACPPDHWLICDRLELDLGVIAAEVFEEEVLAKLSLQLRRELAKMTSNGAASRPRQVGAAAPGSAFSSAEARLETLCCFLTNGRLPWWAGDRSPDELCRELLADPPAKLQERLTLLLPLEPVRRRLAYQLSDQSLSQLVNRLNPANKSLTILLTALLSSGHAAVLPELSTGELRLILWRTALATFAGVQPIYANELRADFWRRLLTTASLPASAWRRLLETAPLPAAERTRVQRALDQAPSDRFRPHSEGNSKAKPRQPAAPPLSGDLPAEPDVALDDELAGIAVDGAGLVLLWPYWSNLFKECGLLEAGGFRDREAQERAVHLLSYLATGRQGEPEPRLVLPKLLCGLELEAPIAREVVLTVAELAAAAQLLTAAIGHWQALKSTSAVGLRTAFLQRPGLLRRQQCGWRLQVERRSHDMLLEQLPWGIGLIKTSWMPSMLAVEWI